MTKQIKNALETVPVIIPAVPVARNSYDGPALIYKNEILSKLEDHINELMVKKGYIGQIKFDNSDIFVIESDDGFCALIHTQPEGHKQYFNDYDITLPARSISAIAHFATNSEFNPEAKRPLSEPLSPNFVTVSHFSAVFIDGAIRTEFNPLGNDPLFKHSILNKTYDTECSIRIITSGAIPNIGITSLVEIETSDGKSHKGTMHFNSFDELVAMATLPGECTADERHTHIKKHFEADFARPEKQVNKEAK